jgi:hypothetical protein
MISSRCTPHATLEGWVSSQVKQNGGWQETDSYAFFAEIPKPYLAEPIELDSGLRYHSEVSEFHFDGVGVQH